MRILSKFALSVVFLATLGAEAQEVIPLEVGEGLGMKNIQYGGSVTPTCTGNASVVSVSATVYGAFPTKVRVNIEAVGVGLTNVTCTGIVFFQKRQLFNATVNVSPNSE